MEDKSEVVVFVSPLWRRRGNVSADQGREARSSRHRIQIKDIPVLSKEGLELTCGSLPCRIACVPWQ